MMLCSFASFSVDNMMRAVRSASAIPGAFIRFVIVYVIVMSYSGNVGMILGRFKRALLRLEASPC